MEWMVVIALLIIGAILLVVELLFMPGSMIIGFIGILSNLMGIGLSYSYFGLETAVITAGISGVINALTFYKAFQKGTWKKITLHKTLEPKALDAKLSEKLFVGESGVALSALRPSGTADFQGDNYEVFAKSGLIEAGKPITIVKISGAKIYVKEADTL